MPRAKHCVDDDGVGEHYHCPFCGCVCSAQGHTSGCPPLGQRPAYAHAHAVLKSSPRVAHVKPAACEIEIAYTDVGGEG
jgi:hypothetical protein